MNNKNREALDDFLTLFEQVFDKDWSYSKERMGIIEETEEQKENAKNMGLETIDIISAAGTFLNPKVEDEFEDWGARGALLQKYRELKQLLQKSQ